MFPWPIPALIRVRLAAGCRPESWVESASDTELEGGESGTVLADALVLAEVGVGVSCPSKVLCRGRVKIALPSAACSLMTRHPGTGAAR